MRGDGTFDTDELVILHKMAGWIAVHGEANYGTRPFKTYGQNHWTWMGTWSWEYSVFTSSTLPFTTLR
jgi:alpha-L-fucosidase